MKQTKIIKPPPQEQGPEVTVNGHTLAPEDIDVHITDERKIIVLCPRNTELVSNRAGSRIMLRPTKIECVWITHWYHGGQHRPSYVLTGPRILVSGREGGDITRTYYSSLTNPDDAPPQWVRAITDPRRPPWSVTP